LDLGKQHDSVVLLQTAAYNTESENYTVENTDQSNKSLMTYIILSVVRLKVVSV